MAAKEIYDYVDTVVPDVDQTLSISPQNVLDEFVDKNDIIHEMDDDSDEVVELSSTYVFYIIILYDLLNQSDAGTIFDFWCDPNKGRGRVNSFKFSHPDGHTYVVRFTTSMNRRMTPTAYGIKEIRLKIIGKISD